MKIALVQCPCYSIRMPPLGIAYLCAALKREGYPVEVFDFNADLYWQYQELWKQENDVYWFPSTFFLKGEELKKHVDLFAGEILQSDAEVIGFSVVATSRVFSELISKRIKELDKSRIIIFGGPECYRERPECFFETAEVDYIVQGEGEATLIELLSKVKDRLSAVGCDGVISREDGQIVYNAPRKLIENLDLLPFPDFSLFDKKRYLEKDILPVLASRGCIRKCVFCFDIQYYQRKYRVRSPENIVDGIECLIKNYDIKAIEFNDLLLNGNPKILERMCELMIQRNIRNISWCGSAAVRTTDKELLIKMHDVGCRSLNFGIESGSQKVLDLMDKETTIESISSLIKNTTEVGIAVIANWIIGFPGEERQDLIDTMRFIIKYRRYLSGTGSVCILAINSRTNIYHDAQKRGICLSEDSAFDWKYENNVLTERRHRERVFRRFLDELGLLDGVNNQYAYDLLEDSQSAEKIINRYTEALNNDEQKAKD